MDNYFLGVYEKSMPSNISWKEKLLSAKVAGFDFVEICIDETDEKLNRLDMSKNERRDLVDIMFETDIPIRTMCLSGHRKFSLGSTNVSIRNRGLEIMYQAIDLACDLGIRIIQLAGYDVYYEQSTPQTEKLFLENLHKCVEMASKRGVTLAFETMETPFMNTVSKAMHYVNLINSPFLQIYPDLGNLTNAAVLYKDNLIYDINIGRRNIVAFHLKETLPEKFREVPFGSGHVDFTNAIRTALDIGVRLFVGEFWYVGNADWNNDLIFTKKFFNDSFMKAQQL